MKYIFLILLCALSISSIAQTKTLINPPTGNRNTITHFADGLAYDSVILMRPSCGVPTWNMLPYMNALKFASIALDSCNNVWYGWNPKLLAWSAIGGSGGSETMQQTFDNSITATDNPIIDANGNVFNIDDANNIYLYSHPHAPNNFASNEMVSRDSTATRYSGYSSSYGVSGGDTSMIASVFATNQLTGISNIFDVKDTAVTLSQFYGGAGSDNTIQKFAHPPPIVGQLYYIPVSVNGEVADPAGNITVSTGSRDTAGLIQGNYIFINNADSTYKPNGSDVVIDVDTASIHQYIVQVMNNDTTINNFDSSDVTYFVDSIVCAPPPGAINGDIYLICASGATGDFTGKENQIVERVGGSWAYTIPAAGDIVAVNNPLLAYYKFNGTIWKFIRFTVSWGGDRLGTAGDIGNKSNRALSLVTNNNRQLTITGAGKLRVRDFRGADTAKNFVYVKDSVTGELGIKNRKELVAGTGITITASPTADTISSTGGGGGTTDYQAITATDGQDEFEFTSVPTSYNDFFITVNQQVWDQSAYTKVDDTITLTATLNAGDVVTFRRIK